ncbi:MAG: methyltransferase domain-containing protein [Candidatus Heimdallarchaeota archaeon]|nr:methyltransferase domain-containing protein [Candidatus Heimdallarchaeota archaeon]
MVEDKGYEKSAHLYDLFDKKENIPFFHHFAQQAGKILDIGAGTGRIAIPLARKGIKVVCVEPSPAMRKEFNKKIEKEPILRKNITLIDDSAQSFQLQEQFPAAFLSGCFDHFLSDKERITSLANINHHLQRKGKLIFDIFIGLMTSTPLRLVDEIKREAGFEYKRYIGSKVQPRERIEILLVYKIYKNGELVETIEQKSTASKISREKVHQLLNETGFVVLKEYQDYQFQPFEEGNNLLIIEAEKKGETTKKQNNSSMTVQR